MNTNERIKLLRKELGLTQNEFGEKIGLKKSAISQIENGSTSSNPRIVQLICTAFNISEKWLTEGKGDMYTSDEKAILDKLAGMYDLSESQMIFAKQWLQLPATAKDAVVDYIVSVASALQKKSTKNDVSESDTSKIETAQKAGYPVSVPEDAENVPVNADAEKASIDSKVEAYRKELEAEAKGKTLSASPTGSSPIENRA